MRIDTVIENAGIITMDEARPTASRIGISAGRIVGFDDDLDGVGAAETIDLEGRCLLPGFIDAHTHLQFTGQALSAVDIGPAQSRQEALDLIAEGVKGTDADAWIEVVGYDQRSYGGHLTAPELDAVGGRRRIWARHISSHAAAVSSAVLDQIEDRALLEDPQIARGILIESNQALVRDQRLPYAVDEIAEFIRAAALDARADGVTFCSEAGIGGFLSLSSIDVASYLAVAEAGSPVRLELMPSFDTLEERTTHESQDYTRALSLGLRTGFGVGGKMQIGAQKIMLDGGMMVRAARMSEPYVDTDNCGSWQFDCEVMRRAVIEGHAAGWQLAIHAIGDAAMDLALDYLEEARSAHPGRGARHRIEHGGAIRPDQIPRIASLGVSIVTQPSFIHDSAHDFADILGPDRADWLYRGRSLLDAGVRLIGSTDRPLPGTPLSGIQAFVDRRNRTGRILAAHEAISAYEALAMYTVHGAWITGLDKSLGRLKEGYLADLCVLGANPLVVDTSEISSIPVIGTFLEGTALWN